MLETQNQSISSCQISPQQDVIRTDLRPLDRFLLALKAPETKRQYPKRLESFLTFLNFNGILEEKLESFCSIIKSESDGNWVTNQLLRFLSYQKDRVSKREIEESTISNYFKAIKLFCDMNNIIIIQETHTS